MCKRKNQTHQEPIYSVVHYCKTQFIDVSVTIFKHSQILQFGPKFLSSFVIFACNSRDFTIINLGDHESSTN